VIYVIVLKVLSDVHIWFIFYKGNEIFLETKGVMNEKILYLCHVDLMGVHR